MAITIVHNPSCSKSREALTVVKARTDDYMVVDYLKNPPSRATLTEYVGNYDGPAIDLVRVTDAKFKILGVDPESLHTDDAIIDLLVAHPEVLQRPLVIRGDRLVIGRPTELVETLLD